MTVIHGCEWTTKTNKQTKTDEKVVILLQFFVHLLSVTFFLNTKTHKHTHLTLTFDTHTHTQVIELYSHKIFSIFIKLNNTFKIF